MLEHCDFVEQASNRDGDGRLLRPDLIVKLPGGQQRRRRREDAARRRYSTRSTHRHRRRRAPPRTWPTSRTPRPGAHRSAERQVSTGSSSRRRPTSSSCSCRARSFFRCALEDDPSLIEVGASAGVIFASPDHADRAAARGRRTAWREETIAESARTVSELGRELYERLATMVDHFAKVGSNLDAAVQALQRDRRLARDARARHGAEARAARRVDRRAARGGTARAPVATGGRRGAPRRSRPCASCRPPTRPSSVAQERSDPLDRAELRPVPGERAHRAAVGERAMHGDVDAVLARLHPRRVERARAVLSLRAAARRALVRKPLDALLEEQQLDAAVRRGLERLVPARRRAAAPAGLLLPALERLRLLGEPRLLEERQRELEQLGRRRVPLARRRARRRSSPSRARAGRRTPPAPPPGRRRRRGARARGARDCRGPRRRSAGGPAQARRCGAGSAPATSRPDRAAPAVPR